MERRGRRGFWVAAGLTEEIIPERPVCTDEGDYVPLDYEQMDGTLSDHHPDELMPECLDYIRQAAEAWDVGILPVPGSLMDQPAKLISGIKIWRNQLRRAERLRQIRMGGQ